MKISGKWILSHAEVVISGMFLMITVLVVIVNVLLRYLFSGGLFWVEEVATISFVWSIFTGSAAAYRHKLHIGIDLITKLFHERVKEILTVVINALMVIINGYICYLSILMIQANKLKRTPVLDVPSIYVNLAITVGFFLITVHAVRFLFMDIALLRSGRRIQTATGGEEKEGSV